ncbi:MAG: ribosomal protein S18-alanine N-acetyltransferase, partial [Aeromonadaceae bacterium]
LLEATDLPAMLEVEQLAHPYPWSEAVLASSFGERYRNLGLWHGSLLVGFSIADLLLDESTLHNICLRPDYRGRGWGRLLLEHYLTLTHEQGCRQWWLEVRRSNLLAQQLYLRAGYQQVGVRKGYYQTHSGTEDALVMLRTLT